MYTAVDYSHRRGVIVPLLPQIYALMNENADKDKQSGLQRLENIVLWKQAMRKMLVDIERRWLFVFADDVLAGLMFYRFSDSESVHIEELQLAWAFRYDSAVFSLLLDKFQFDDRVKQVRHFYAGTRIKIEEPQEILAAAGFQTDYENGYQLLGSLADTVKSLKIRYIRG